MSIRYQWSPPSRLLQPYVARYWQIESDGPCSDAAGRWALPDGGSEWLFVLADPLVRGSRIHRAGAYAAGIALSAYPSKPAGRAAVFGIAFRPGGAAAFSRLPARELAGCVVPLDALWGPAGATATERMARAPVFEARVQLIQRELLAHLRPTDVEVTEAIARLTANPGLAVSSLAADPAGTGRLERKFLASVGIGPKRLARMFRLQHAIRLWEQRKVRGWADLASAAGYSDQAHMIREYGELAGSSPARLAKDARRMSDFFNTGHR